MCKFFSFVSNGYGKYFFMDASVRRRIVSGDLDYETDSHSSIADYHQRVGSLTKGEDTCNKYEFNPWTRKFTVDQINAKDDRFKAEAWVRQLDFSVVEPRVVIKPIVHPFDDLDRKRVSKRDIDALQEMKRVVGSVMASVRASVMESVWVSVRASFRASVGYSVGVSVSDSVWESVGYSVGGSVRDSVWASVRDSFRASVGYSVWGSVSDSVWASVRDSFRASVYVYISSFVRCDDWKHIKHDPGENPFKPIADMWERGIVPSYDGTTWRLHGGKEVKVLYEENESKLEAQSDE